jgi:hypothetical protein
MGSKLLFITSGATVGIITDHFTQSFPSGCLSTVVYSILAWGAKTLLDYFKDRCEKSKKPEDGNK